MCDITIRLGESSHHIIEDVNVSLETSIFSDQYKKTLSILEDRYKLLKAEAKNKEKEKGKGKVKGKDEFIYNPLNNIISFIGDRGSGKTSCMLSVAKLLDKGLDGELASRYVHLNKLSFYRMDLIDPSFFDKSHNVIELFLANLFGKFQDRRKKTKYYEEKQNITKIIECFTRAQKDMAEMMVKPIDKFEPIDNLQRLSAGVSLNEDIKNLVDAFLEYFEKQGGVLIVPIDDVDLNSGMAAEMLEQIRKYLIHPNILVLLSVKLDQLALTKRLGIEAEYSSLKNISANLSEMFDGMVETYLTKTLPHHQRIYMPDGTAYFDKSVRIMDGDKELAKYDSVRDMVPELIFRKTRYLFYNTAESTSYIVPSNLRQLNMLVNMLYGMVDYYEGKYINDYSRYEGSQAGKYNQFTFQKYLYENWVPENLTQAMQSTVGELLEIQDVAQVNAKVLAILNSFFPQLSDGLSKDGKNRSELDLILDPSNKIYNIALGDVLDIIDMLEESETQNIKLKFIFFLRSFYSILLFETYSKSMNNLDNKDDIEHVVTQNTFSELNLWEYEKLVAGYFFNSRLTRIVPVEQISKLPRAYRNINFNEFIRIRDEVVNSGNNNDPRLPLLEFFMLGISRRFKTKNDGFSDQYRKGSSVFYAESLTGLQKNAYFDLGAFLFNLVRIQDCYYRFKSGDILFNMALESDISLHTQFCNKREEMGRRWLPWCCFRNAEVIRAFKAHMATIESPGGDAIKVLVESFRKMAKFKLHIYDKDEKGQYKLINFQYFDVVADMLMNLPDSNDFIKIYYDPDPDPEDNRIPEYIDASMILKTAQKEKNRVDTRINKILQTYPIVSKYYSRYVYGELQALGKHASRRELASAISNINRFLERFRDKD